MLNINKEIRYTKFEQISGHAWFKDFDWEALISLDMQTEYFPKIDEKQEITVNKIPYNDYIKTIPEWEMPEQKPKISEQYKLEFEEWFKRF